MSGSDPLPSPVPEYLALSFPAPPKERPYVILNMVSSADGKAIAGGTETPLSSPSDKLVLQSLRVHADAILNGAGTARATGVNPSIWDPALRERRRAGGRPEPPLQAVLSGSANLGVDAPFMRQHAFRLVIFVCESAPRDRVDALRAAGRDIEVIPNGAPGLRELVRRLRQSYQVGLLLLEGGPTLNAGLFHAGLIDEMFLTVGPHIVAGWDIPTSVEGDPFLPATMPALELLSVYRNKETSEVYLRWQVQH